MNRSSTLFAVLIEPSILCNAVVRPPLQSDSRHVQHSDTRPSPFRRSNLRGGSQKPSVSRSASTHARGSPERPTDGLRLGLQFCTVYSNARPDHSTQLPSNAPPLPHPQIDPSVSHTELRSNGPCSAASFVSYGTGSSGSHLLTERAAWGCGAAQ
jgi:hypothetical protein